MGTWTSGRTVVVALMLLLAATARGGAAAGRMAYLTFSAPVALPGVTLEAGTYIFQIPESTTGLSLVSVRESQDDRPCFLGFTQPIERPGGAVPAVTFGEAAPGVPIPILAWFPKTETMGYKFLYR